MFLEQEFLYQQELTMWDLPSCHKFLLISEYGCVCRCVCVCVWACICVWECVCAKCVSQRIKPDDLSMSELPLLTVFEERIKRFFPGLKCSVPAACWPTGAHSWGAWDFQSDCRSSLFPECIRQWCPGSPISAQYAVRQFISWWGVAPAVSPFPLFSEKSSWQEEGPCSHNMRPVATAFECFVSASFCFWMFKSLIPHFK